MTPEEIFAKVKTHFLEGMVFHDEMARYYSFLNLKGYAKCHEYHYYDESIGYKKLCNYYMEHYNRFIPNGDMERPDVIPDSWYQYSRQDVDNGTKQSAIKTGVTTWADWERKTKDLYEEMYIELLDNGEVAAALFLSDCIKDVGDELRTAEQKHLMLESIGYDLNTVASWQDEIHSRYKTKLNNLINLDGK